MNINKYWCEACGAFHINGSGCHSILKQEEKNPYCECARCEHCGKVIKEELQQSRWVDPFELTGTSELMFIFNG